MQAAMPLSENMQKRIIGMAALLLTGSSITPANLQAVQMISQRNVNMTDKVPVSYNYYTELSPPERVTNPELAEAKVKVMNIQEVKVESPVTSQVKIPQVQVEVSQVQAENVRGTNLGTLVTSEEGSAIREKIIESVLSWQGVPYRWGGRTRSGVDCSALVQRVFNENGITLPRTSYDQFRQGVGIPKSKLEPGDLVFFNTAGSGASHVGIYIGENNFISATRSCVEIESLDSDYWASNYRGSRRIIS